MIIKASSRGQSRQDAARLARHLLADENESVAVLEIRGLAAADLPGAIEEARLLSLATRARKGLYHASINVDRPEAAAMTDARWAEAVAELEKQMGFSGHARVVVKHCKHGRAHVHTVWSRVHPVSLKVASDSHNYRVHEAVSRTLESRWGLRPVVGVFTRPKGTRRPVAAATHAEQMGAERVGKPVALVAATLRRAWETTTTARAFQSAIAAEQLCLARGRRGMVVVDNATGLIHSLPRRLGLRAAEVNRRMAAINITGLPDVEAVQSGRNDMPRKPQFGAMRRRRRSNEPATPEQPLSPDYWRGLGFEVMAHPTHLTITLSPTTTLQDYGDRMVLSRHGDPTDAEIAAMVLAGKGRGWDGIRFFGGSPAYQLRAREIALQHGFPPEKISLEIEDNLPKAVMAGPMPDHIKAKLKPPSEPTEAAQVPDTPVPPLPAPEMRL